METLVIHPKNSKQAKTLKAVLKALNVKVDSIPSFKEEQLPAYVVDLMKKGIEDANQNKLTPNDKFMGAIKSKYLK